MERQLATNWKVIPLSENFTLGEFVISESHPELADQIIPTWQQANNLYVLCKLAMQPLRDEYGLVKITRGLASEELNKAIGGVKDSQHIFGEAVDFIIPEIGMVDAFAFCTHELKWQGECIFYRKKGHIHISLPNLFVKANQFIKED